MSKSNNQINDSHDLMCLIYVFTKYFTFATQIFRASIFQFMQQKFTEVTARPYSQELTPQFTGSPPEVGQQQGTINIHVRKLNC